MVDEEDIITLVEMYAKEMIESTIVPEGVTFKEYEESKEAVIKAYAKLYVPFLRWLEENNYCCIIVKKESFLK